MFSGTDVGRAAARRSRIPEGTLVSAAILPDPETPTPRFGTRLSRWPRLARLSPVAHLPHLTQSARVAVAPTATAHPAESRHHERYRVARTVSLALVVLVVTGTAVGLTVGLIAAEAIELVLAHVHLPEQ